MEIPLNKITVAFVALGICHSLQAPCIFPPRLWSIGGPYFRWLTCLPPFFGLCWAPLLGPALLAPLVPSGALGPDAHSQSCSHLKGEARQLSEGRLRDVIQ